MNGFGLNQGHGLKASVTHPNPLLLFSAPSPLPRTWYSVIMQLLI